MAPTGPTDRQLRASIYKVAHAYLEVERGLRAYDQLERFLTPAEHRRHRNRPSDPRLRTGQIVLPTDIGPIHIDRHLPGQITATLTTRETHDRWGALVLHLVCQEEGRWRIDQLERLRRPTVARQHTAHEPPDLDQRIDHVEDERRLVDAAFRATTTRLAEVNDQSGATQDDDRELLRAQQQVWKRRRAELDDEREQLRDRRELHEPFTNPEVVAPATADTRTELTDQQLVEVLGPIPEDQWRRRLWTGLAEEISTYRERWNISDPRTLLGGETDDPRHQRDREVLADTLRAAAPQFSREPQRSPDLPREADLARSAARRHGRGVVTER